MKELMETTISKGNITCLIITAVLLVVLPIVFLIIWKKKCKKEARWKALLIGAIGFLVSARVLELGFHMIFIVMDNPISRVINGNIVLFVLYGIFMAGFFEEVGRYVILKHFVKKENTVKNAVMYGIGHGGIEVYAISLATIISYLTVAIMLQNGITSETLTALHITESNVGAFLPVLEGVTSFGVGSLIVTVIERVLCMFIHISLTVIVYDAVKQNKKSKLVFAVVLHMLVDSIPALSQKMTISPIVTEIWCAVWAIVLTVIAVKCYSKYSNSNEKSV